MKVKAVKDFWDYDQNVKRHVGDTWEVTANRLQTLVSTGFGQSLEKVTKTPETAKKRAQTRNKRED